MDIIIPAAQVAQTPESDIYRCSYLCSQLAEIFSYVFIADKEPIDRSHVNPFWDVKCKKPSDNVEKYTLAFVVNDLYVQLQELLEANGYVVETSTQSTSIKYGDSCQIPYYPGTSTIFVPRIQPTSCQPPI